MRTGSTAELLRGSSQPEAGVQGDDQEMGLELVLQVEWVG